MNNLTKTMIQLKRQPNVRHAAHGDERSMFERSGLASGEGRRIPLPSANLDASQGEEIAGWEMP
jgi:hypothetical protein